MAKKLAASKPPSALKRFAQLRGVPVGYFFLSDIDLDAPIRLERALRGKDYQELELVLQSPGGNPHAAYQIVTIARSHAKKIRACVPYFAKSAATLICLGADVIILSEVAQLGPLDTQVREREAAGKFKYGSALNPSKAIDQLRRYSLETFDLAVRMLLEASDLDHAQASDRAIEFVKATTGQLFSGLDALKIGEYSRALAIGKEYGNRLLNRSNVIPEASRRRVLDALVEGYPSHDFIIDHHELKNLGFNVELLGADSMSLFSEVVKEEEDNFDSLVKVVTP